MEMKAPTTTAHPQPPSGGGTAAGLVALGGIKGPRPGGNFAVKETQGSGKRTKSHDGKHFESGEPGAHIDSIQLAGIRRGSAHGDVFLETESQTGSPEGSPSHYSP